MEKRLHRSLTDRKIAGVCGGIAEYLGWDPTLVRILWVVLTLLGGSGIVAYLVLWLLMPEGT
ncbi:PspC domain-containing protein [Dyella silvae]|jgi:phage shock protein PspC (stress-responsive transcriptional regulator)|uniref:PspC domain-containing protein n=1 Tax=Dyella silvae TaxID=2994424 RepID=UPI0022656251|nr:PspC domain-containing protein [Dyella silvae]